MAEIKIEKKKPVWPWILLGLIILGIILYFVFADNDNEVDDMDDATTEQVDTTYTSTQMDSQMERETATDTSSGSVSNYIAHVGDQSRMGIDHEYTNNAIIHLIEAVNAKANEHNVDVTTDMQSIRQDAQQITQNPQATNHANKIKDAGTKLADVLKKIQEQQFPDLSSDVEEVKTAANNIQPSVLTLEQKDQINTFFNEAADVLKKMS